MEIGSEFWLETKPEFSKNKNLPEWLKKFGNEIYMLSTGRGAINLVLESINPKVKVALLPIYICESVILPFKENGYDIEYYAIDKNLSPKGLENVQWENIGVFFHLGYFGFDTNSELKKYSASIKKNNVIVVEDVTHSMFSKYNNIEFNDFVIGSIRKWFGVPSGGFLASKKTIEKRNLTIDSQFTMIRKKNLVLKSEYIQNQDKGLKKVFLEGLNQAETLIDQNISSNSIDPLSFDLITNLDESKLNEKRRNNYQYLAKSLHGFKDFGIYNKYIEKDTVPIFFPIYSSEKRDEIREILRGEDIYCPIHWPLPSQVKDFISPESLSIYNTILSIPCDQRYEQADMERIVSVLKRYFN